MAEQDRDSSGVGELATELRATTALPRVSAPASVPEAASEWIEAASCRELAERCLLDPAPGRGRAPTRSPSASSSPEVGKEFVGKTGLCGRAEIPGGKDCRAAGVSSVDVIAGARWR